MRFGRDPHHSVQILFGYVLVFQATDTIQGALIAAVVVDDFGAFEHAPAMSVATTIVLRGGTPPDAIAADRVETVLPIEAAWQGGKAKVVRAFGNVIRRIPAFFCL